MLNWIINSVVGKLLNDYLEFDPSKTNTGITTGKYVLENIKIKKDVFYKINLPFFEIKNSFIGKISIELTKLATFHPEDYPIIVKIEDIFINVSQKGIKEWDEVKKLEELQNAKNIFLKQIEDFYSNYLESHYNTDNQKSSDFFKKLVNNLEMSICNVIVRIEDDISYPSNPYALGLSLKTLKTEPFLNRQNQFKIHENQIETLVIQKLLIMDDFSLFMDIGVSNTDNDYVNFITENGNKKALDLDYYLKDDIDERNWYAYCHSELADHLNDESSHAYIIHNLDFELQLEYNQDYLLNQEEYIRANINIRKIEFNLTLQQIKVLLKVSAFITGISSSYYFEIEEKCFKKKMDLKLVSSYINNYIDYFDKKHIQQKEEIEYKKNLDILEVIEENFKFDYLQKLRYLTYDKLKFLSKLNNLEKKIKEKTPGLVSGFFTSEQTLVELEKYKIERSELLKNKEAIYKKLEFYIENINNNEYIEKEIEDEKNLAKEEELKKLPVNYVKISFKLKIHKLKVSLKTKKIYIKNKYVKKDSEEQKSKRKYDRMNFLNNLIVNNDEDHNLLEENEKYIEDIIILNLKNLETLVLMGLEKMELYLFLGDIEVLQYLSKHKTFKKILESHFEKNFGDIDSSLYYNPSVVEKTNAFNSNDSKFKVTKEKEDKKYTSDNIDLEYPKIKKSYNLEDNNANMHEREFDIKCGALFVSFEMNPDLPGSYMRVRIRNSKRLYIYLNLYCMQMLGFLLSEVLNSEMDFDTIAKNTTAKSYQNIKKGYDSMKNQFVQGDYKPFAIHADIILKSPRIIFPQDITNNKNKNCILISMGEFTLKSHLANRIPSDTVINVRTLKYYDNLFDNYDINLLNFEVNVIYNFKDLDILNNDLMKEEKIYHKIVNLIDKLNIDIMLSQLIEPKNIFNEKFKVGIKIEDFVLNINEKLVEFISETLYFYYYFSIFYEIEINIIKKDPVFIKLTDIKNKNIIDPIINYGEIDEKFNENINKINENENEIEKKPEEEKDIDDEIKLKSKTGKPKEVEKIGFINRLNNKLKGQDEIEIAKNYEVEKLNKIREKILKGERERLLLEFNLIIEKININFQKMINEEEKEILEKFNKDINAELLKPFFNISMIELRINLGLMEDFGLIFLMAMEYFLIYDNDFTFKIEDDKLINHIILNTDFQFFFSSNRNPFEKKEPYLHENISSLHKNGNLLNEKVADKNLNLQASDVIKVFKGAYQKNTAHIKKLNRFTENKKILENEDSKKNNLFYMSLNINKKKNLMKIKTFINDLRLILNISTLARMKVYFYKISEIYSKITYREIPLQKTLDQIKEEERQNSFILNKKIFDSLIKTTISHVNLVHKKDNENGNLNNENKENENEINEKKKNFLKKLKDRLKYRRENQGKEIPINYKKLEDDEVQKLFDMLYDINEYGKNNDLYFENEHIRENEIFQNNNNEFKFLRKNYFYKEEKYKMKFLIYINTVDIEIPLNAEDYKTEMIFINLKLNFKYISLTENQDIFEYKFIDNEVLDFSIGDNLMKIMSDKNFKNNLSLVAKYFTKNDMNVTFMLNDLDINVENYIGGLIFENNLKEKLVSNMRISGFYKKFVFIKKKSYITSSNIKIEPILISMGISHLKVFQNYSNHFTKVLTETDEKAVQEVKQREEKENKLKIKEFQRFEEMPLDNLLTETNKQQFIDPHKIPGENIKTKTSRENVEKTDRHALIAEGAKFNNELNEPKIKNLLEANVRNKLQSNKIHRPKETKKQKEIIFNLRDFNELFDIELNLEKLKAELYDDLKKYMANLVILETSNLNAKYITNTKPYDTENFFKFFIELISNQQAKNLNLLNMYFYLKLKLLLEVKLFNEKFYNWEPILEPLDFNFTIHQIEKSAKIIYKINCDKMIDINLSTNLIFTINKIMKVLKHDSNEKHTNKILSESNNKSRVYKCLKVPENMKDLYGTNNTKKDAYGSNDSKKVLDGTNELKKEENAPIKKILPILNLGGKSKVAENNKGMNGYKTFVNKFKKNFLAKKNDEKLLDEKFLKLKNEAGIDLTCILLDRTNINNFIKPIPNNNFVKIYKSEISDIYFDEYNDDIKKKISSNNKLKIYINEIDYLIENIDFQTNNNSIIRIDSDNWKQPDNILYAKLNGVERGNFNNIKNDENKNKFFCEILIKTKFIKNAKIIIFESNINFFNNTNHYIRIAFVKNGILNSSLQKNDIKKTQFNENMGDKIQKENSDTNSITSLAEEIFVCNYRDHVKIPVKYLFKNYEVYIGLIFKKAKMRYNNNVVKKFISNLLKIDYEYQEVFRLYCSSMKFIYVLGIEYINMELNNLKSQVKENYLKDLNEKYCSLISFESDLFEGENSSYNKIIIASEILLLKSDDDITFAGDSVDLKDKDELIEAREKSFCFTIVFNNPIVISNKTPKEFILNIDPDKEFLHANEPNNFIISPLENLKFYLFDMFENSKFTRLGFKSDANLKIIDFITHSFHFKINDNQKSRLRFCNRDNKNDYVDLIIETEKNMIDRIYKPNFYTEEYYFCKSRIINLYFEIVVINRLEKHIVFNPLSKYFSDESIKSKTKDFSKNENKYPIIDINDKPNENVNMIIKANKNINSENEIINIKEKFENPDNYTEEELEFFRKNKKSYLIRTGEIGVFTIMDPIAKAKIKIGNSEFSNDFKFDSDSLNKISKFATTNKQFEFHCLYRTSYTFNFSKILILEPRYYILNKTKLNIKYREVHFQQGKNGEKNKEQDKYSEKNRIYNNKINQLKPEEEKIFLLENREFAEQGKQNLSKKDLMNEKKKIDNKTNLNNIQEFNFVQFLIDDKYNYSKNKQAVDDIIEKDDDLGTNIYAEIFKKEKNLERSSSKNDNDLEIKNNSNIHYHWSNLINLDIDQDIDFKLQISKDFYLECLGRIKKEAEFLENNDLDQIDTEQLNKVKQIITLKNLFTYDNEKFYVLLRMTSRKYDNGIRYLILSEPEYPDLVLKNTTQYDVIVNQVGSEDKAKIIKNSEQTVTLSEFYDLQSENLHYIEIEIKELNIKSKVSLKKIHDLIDLDENKVLKTENKLKPDNLLQRNAPSQKVYAYIDTENSNITRIIKIFDKKLMHEKSDFYMSDLLKNKSSSYIIDLKLKGIGLSLLNLYSQEYFYISFYKIKFQSSNNMIKSLNYINDKADILLKIYNIQIDYCKENIISKKKIDRLYKNNFTTVFVPNSQYIPYKEIDIVHETFFPFLNLNLVTNTFLNSEKDLKTNKISNINFNLGEFILTLDQNILSSLLEIILEFSDELDFNKKSTEKERDSAVDERLEFAKETQKKNGNNDNVNINQPKQLILGNNLSKAIDRTGYRLKGSIMNIKFFSEAYLKTAIESAERKLIELNNDSIFYIENLRMFPIVFKMTTKIDISSIKLSGLPQNLQNLLGFFANSLANISDLNILFEKVEIEDLYDRINNILKEVSTRYSNQVFGFVGEIISNTNLMGNPFKQFNKVKKKIQNLNDEDNELKLKYGKEAHKKLNSLFKISMEKGFDAIDKIIKNTLHLKSLKGNPKSELITNPNNHDNHYNDQDCNKYLIQEGTIEIKERQKVLPDIEMHLVRSDKRLLNEFNDESKNEEKYDITKRNNIIFNPLLNSQNSINKQNELNIGDNYIQNKISLMTALANPVFNIYEKEMNLDSNNMFDFYYSDKKLLNIDRPKIETNRFRHPRINLEKTYIKNYNYSDAEITMMLLTFFSQKDFKQNMANIVYTKNLFTYDNSLIETYTSIIITESQFFAISEAKLILFEFQFKNLEETKIYKLEKSNKFKMIFHMTNRKEYFFLTKDFDNIYEIESIIEKIKKKYS